MKATSKMKIIPAAREAPLSVIGVSTKTSFRQAGLLFGRVVCEIIPGMMQKYILIGMFVLHIR